MGDEENPAPDEKPEGPTSHDLDPLSESDKALLEEAERRAKETGGD